jgi:SAM-dependent methyltransferase
VFDYLCVDEFLRDIFHARALSLAFESGLVDAFIKKGTISFESLTRPGAPGSPGSPSSTESRGMLLLLKMLADNKVTEEREGAVALTEKFARALEFRDLMEMKSSLAHLAAHDFLTYFPDFIFRPDLFPRKAKSFRLFAYDGCMEITEENKAKAKSWMKITTTLTKYEAPVCMNYHDFGACRNILDVGGNSGEFALQVCRRYPDIKAHVFDLPIVCEIGREHVKDKPEAGRISFIQGNALIDDLGGPYDLIIFKSMLHDWPEKEAAHFLARAGRALAPGGTLLIFERAPLEEAETGLFYSMLPMLVFFHSFRSPGIYETCLKELGFGEIEIKAIHLDTPFFLLKASKKIN